MTWIPMAGRSGLNFEVNMGTTKQVGVGREFFSEIIDGNFYLYPSPPLWKNSYSGHVQGVFEREPGNPG